MTATSATQNALRRGQAEADLRRRERRFVLAGPMLALTLASLIALAAFVAVLFLPERPLRTN